jgi:RND family efflux transporter MFP subunit
VSPASVRRFALLSAAALVLAAAAALVHRRRHRARAETAAAPARSAPASVRAYRVRRRELRAVLARDGTVRSRAETPLQFGAAGRLAEFPVEEGRFVRKGAVVARLDPSEAENALRAAGLDFQKASVKYFEDRLIDKVEYERARLRHRQARLEFEKTVLRAPHDGYLVDRRGAVGERVEPGMLVGRLVDRRRVYVELSLPERDAPMLKPGQTAEVTVDAAPGLKLEGRVESVTPYLQGTARAFAVKLRLPENPGEALSPGMFARCLIRRHVKPSALVVPREAAGATSEDSARVFLVGPQDRAAARQVTILAEGTEGWEVSGVEEGDVVVLDPPASLADGKALTVTSIYDPAVEASSTPLRATAGDPEGGP